MKLWSSTSTFFFIGNNCYLLIYRKIHSSIKKKNNNNIIWSLSIYENEEKWDQNVLKNCLLKNIHLLSKRFIFCYEKKKIMT